jgi:uncharacterized membrane protein
MNDETGQENQMDDSAREKDVAEHPFWPRLLSLRRQGSRSFTMWVICVVIVAVSLLLYLPFIWALFFKMSPFLALATFLVTAIIFLALYFYKKSDASKR